MKSAIALSMTLVAPLSAQPPGIGLPPGKLVDERHRLEPETQGCSCPPGSNLDQLRHTVVDDSGHEVTDTAEDRLGPLPGRRAGDLAVKGLVRTTTFTSS